jgi:hypothetical protein
MSAHDESLLQERLSAAQVRNSTVVAGIEGCLRHCRGDTEKDRVRLGLFNAGVQRSVRSDQ